MTPTHPPVCDQPVIHQFIRRFGRRPTADELASLRPAQEAGEAPVAVGLRPQLARLIMRW